MATRVFLSLATVPISKLASMTLNLIVHKVASECRVAQRGFTIIEMVMVIVLLGIVSSMVAVFIKAPVEGYAASAWRATMTDEADTVMRRMTREIRGALPNSLRQSSNACIEFIPVKTTARYRSENASGGGGLPLSFTTAGNFDMLGLNTNLSTEQQIAPGDLIVIHNLGSTGGSDAYSATAGVSNSGTVTVGSTLQQNSTASDIAAPTYNPTVALKPNETRIPMTWPSTPPLASSSERFFVVSASEQMVAFVCSNGKLYRSSSASLTTTPSCSTAGASTTVLASDVGACAFDYSSRADLQRNGLLKVNLSLTTNAGTSNATTVTLYQEVHVNNSP